MFLEITVSEMKICCFSVLICLNNWIVLWLNNFLNSLSVIADVIPPDEYNEHVDNSAYTNAIAKLSLQWAIEAHELVDITVPSWHKYADKIYIPFDEDTKFHPEFDGYKIGTWY